MILNSKARGNFFSVFSLRFSKALNVIKNEIVIFPLFLIAYALGFLYGIFHVIFVRRKPLASKNLPAISLVL